MTQSAKPQAPATDQPSGASPPPPAPAAAAPADRSAPLADASTPLATEAPAAAPPTPEEAAAAAAAAAAETQRAFKEAWQATLGALGNAEEETQALLGRLVALGTISREEGARMYTEVRDLVEQRRNELETRVQTAIDQAMKRLTIPTQQDIAEAAQKLAELERRVEALVDRDPRDAAFQHPSSMLDRLLGKKKPAAKK